MVGTWQTQRGDEWWYSDPSLDASAGVNQSPRALVIGTLRNKDAILSSAKLHAFLWRSSQQFPGSQLWLLLDTTTQPLLTALSNAGQIRWETITNPLSQEARITFVGEP